MFWVCFRGDEQFGSLRAAELTAPIFSLFYSGRHAERQTLWWRLIKHGGEAVITSQHQSNLMKVLNSSHTLIIYVYSIFIYRLFLLRMSVLVRGFLASFVTPAAVYYHHSLFVFTALAVARTGCLKGWGKKKKKGTHEGGLWCTPLSSGAKHKKNQIWSRSPWLHRLDERDSCMCKQMHELDLWNNLEIMMLL